ncbi:unnamed protein product [Pieris macdunnoughi]|uniref:Dipeptidyl aminopeptidase-like protein 6 n=1 Tax=Pieris macdunnoughi TaxID=345717 RepID=A0A821SSE2_9NEOP|nr:unnamed protein product [Pieris macdunnoughi]
MELKKYIKKLVVGSPNQRNWRGILIALLVIVLVLALIVTSVVLLTPPDEGPRVKGRRLKIQDLVTDELVPVRWNGTWISDTYRHDFLRKNEHAIKVSDTVNVFTLRQSTKQTAEIV